jgi:hypothetical protein
MSNSFIKRIAPIFVRSLIPDFSNQPFQINSQMLHFLKSHQEDLSSLGLLMPPFLASVNPHLVYGKLKEELTSYVDRKKFHFSHLVDMMDKRIQRARYEQFIIRLASAYEGYKFDLPAFIDLRGRIYRTGI